MRNTRIYYYILFFLILFIAFSCSHRTKTTGLEVELNKIQRQFASTNFQLDALVNKVETLELDLKKQTKELELLKHNR